ncbi:MAG: PRC-barrel domain-containing protein [Prochlorothrix sp.]
MATHPLIQHNQLLHSLVLDRASTEDLGRVDVVWMYPQAHRVLGFICKPSTLSPKRLAFSLPQIHTLNLGHTPKTIWVSSQGTETDADQVRQLQTLLGHEVWTEGGKVLGKVTDCTFSLKTGEIQSYAVALRGLRGMVVEPFVLEPGAILSFGTKRLLVTPSVAKGMAEQEDRIKQTLGDLKQEYRQVREEIKSFSNQAQTLFQKVGSKVQRVGTKVGTRAQQWTQEALETAHSTAQTWQEEWPQQTEQWRDRAQEFAAPFFDPEADAADVSDDAAAPTSPPLSRSQSSRSQSSQPPTSPTPSHPSTADPSPSAKAAPPHSAPPDRGVNTPQVTDDFGEEGVDDLGEPIPRVANDDPIFDLDNWPPFVTEQEPNQTSTEPEIWDQWTLETPESQSPAAAPTASAPVQNPPDSAHTGPGSAQVGQESATPSQTVQPPHPPPPVPSRPPQVPTPPNPPPEELDLDADPWL